MKDAKIMTMPFSSNRLWSTSEIPYLCLIDRKRTLAFQNAIMAAVQPGDVVLDAGSGTGILAFFATKAGASKVYATEIDPLLCDCLRQSIQANDLDHLVEVVEGDAMTVDLPQNVDVVIAELIDTALIEELQVPVINALRKRGIIGPTTRMVPRQYETCIELGNTDFSYYGFKVHSPRYEHPDIARDQESWLATRFDALTNLQKVMRVDLTGEIDPDVSLGLKTVAQTSGTINAARISGMMDLSERVTLGPTNSTNGHLILPVKEIQVEKGQELAFHIAYEMGASVSSIQLRWEEADQ